MAEFVLILHFLFIFYMVIGFPVGLIVNHRGFRLVHAGLLAFISALMILGYPCPLTDVEEYYSSREYGGSFLAAWLNRIIYLEWFEPKSVFIGDMVFAALVFSSFIWRPLPPGKGGA